MKERQKDRRERNVDEQHDIYYGTNMMTQEAPRFFPLVLLVKFGGRRSKR